MIREVTQFSTVEHKLGIITTNPAKLEAISMFAKRIEEGLQTGVNAIENIRTVRLMEDTEKMQPGSNNMPLRYLDFVYKRPLRELQAEEDRKALARWKDMLVDVLSEVGKDIAIAILSAAAVWIAAKLGPKATREQITALAPEAIKRAQDEFKRQVELAARPQHKKGPPAKQDGRQGARKHQGRGKPGPNGRKPQRAA